MLITVGAVCLVSEGDKQGVDDALCYKLELVVVVLKTSKWVQVEHMVVNTNRSE